jgi:hypothetical protein
VPKQTKIVPKRTKVAKKTYIVIPILRTTSGGGAEKDNCSAETEKIGAEIAKIESAEKSAETGGNQSNTLTNGGFQHCRSTLILF